MREAFRIYFKKRATLFLIGLTGSCGIAYARAQRFRGIVAAVSLTSRCKGFGVTLHNNPTPPEGDDRGESSRSHEGERFVFPPAPRVAHHRLLLDTYLENCRSAFTGRNNLITDRREMPLEAPMIFHALETEYRKSLVGKLNEFGMQRMADELTCRMLHPVVAVGKGVTEYHLYADIVNGQGRCVFPDLDGVQSFNSGPAGVQFYATEEKKGELRIRVIRLISAPAFREAVNDIIATPFEAVKEKPRSFVALGWIMSAVCNHRIGGDAGVLAKRGERPGEIILDDVTGFKWMGGRSPASFEFQIKNARYKVDLRFNNKNKRPDTFVFEELP